MSDLINRQDAIDCFWDENRMMRDWLDIIKDIRSLPSAERKRGKWLYKDMKGQFCSVCGKQSVWKFDFCPNCGADMRGGYDEKPM